MNEGVFLDTSGLYAVFDADDRGHTAAAQAWETLLRDCTPLHSSNYVLLELETLLQRRLGIPAVSALTTYVLPWIRITWIDESVHAQAITGVMTAARRDLTLVDCTSFAVMRALGLTRAFALDGHFVEQGFAVVPSLPPAS